MDAVKGLRGLSGLSSVNQSSLVPEDPYCIPSRVAWLSYGLAPFGRTRFTWYRGMAGCFRSVPVRSEKNSRRSSNKQVHLLVYSIHRSYLRCEFCAHERISITIRNDGLWRWESAACRRSSRRSRSRKKRCVIDCGSRNEADQRARVSKSLIT